MGFKQCNSSHISGSATGGQGLKQYIFFVSISNAFEMRKIDKKRTKCKNKKVKKKKSIFLLEKPLVQLNFFKKFEIISFIYSQ